ncbi:MAG: HEAT repeat domain-containing protein, partial [Planctomycetota bacterium]|nr:HEAT repeat domain-containing protein [Planctomycetota bacterium]
MITTDSNCCEKCGTPMRPAMCRCFECGCIRGQYRPTRKDDEQDFEEAAKLLDQISSTNLLTDSRPGEVADFVLSRSSESASRPPYVALHHQVERRTANVVREKPTQPPQEKASRAKPEQPKCEPDRVARSSKAKRARLRNEIAQAIAAVESKTNEFELKRTWNAWTFRKLARQLQLERHLSIEDSSTVCTALASIARSRDRRALDLIDNWTCNASSMIRESAARSLGQLATAGSTRRLLPMLADNSLCVRRAAAEALAECESAEAVRPLLALVQVDPMLRSCVMQALKSMGHSSASVLRELVCRNHVDFGVIAVHSLGYVGGEQSVRAILSACEHESADMRAEVAEALGRASVSTANSALNRLLQDPVAAVREHAAQSLAKLPCARSRNPLMQAMQDVSPIVRKHAAVALGRIGDKHAVDMLISQLGHENIDVVIASVDSLGEINSPLAATPLLERLRNEMRVASPNARLRGRIVSALRGMKSDDIVPSLLDLLGRPATEPEMRRRIVGTLGLSEDERAVKPIEDILASDSDHEVRAAAARALGTLKSPQSETVLTKALQDEFIVRCAAVAALGSRATATAVNSIVIQLRDQAFQIRHQSAAALGKCGDQKALAVLTASLNDKNETVRRAVERSIQQIEDRCGIARKSKLQQWVRRSIPVSLPSWTLTVWPESRTARSIFATTLSL